MHGLVGLLDTRTVVVFSRPSGLGLGLRRASVSLEWRAKEEQHERSGTDKTRGSYPSVFMCVIFSLSRPNSRRILVGSIIISRAHSDSYCESPQHVRPDSPPAISEGWRKSRKYSGKLRKWHGTRMLRVRLAGRVQDGA